MKQGDKLRVIEIIGRRKVKTVKEGKIISINDKTITMMKEKNGQATFRESFTIGDLLTKEKRFQINEGKGWENVKFKIEGDKVVLFKVNK